MSQHFLIIFVLLLVTISAQRLGGHVHPGISKINMTPLDQQQPVMGGWKPCDTTDPGLIQSTEFAIHQLFPNSHPRFEIVFAQKQVVAGLKYDMRVQVHSNANTCQVFHFQVWDRFGDRTLKESNPLPNPCV